MNGSKAISLRDTERRVFATSFQHGLWDVFLGGIAAIYAAMLLLSPTLGDYWSAAVFVPVWAGLYWLVRWLQSRVVTPRVGKVEFGRARKGRLRGFVWVMLALNIVMLILGLVAALRPVAIGWAVPILAGITLLVFFSVGGWFLDCGRLIVYGLMLGLSPVVGEWLWRRGLVSHHGLPVMFGAMATVMIGTGVILFLRVLRLPLAEPESRESREE